MVAFRIYLLFLTVPAFIEAVSINGKIREHLFEYRKDSDGKFVLVSFQLEHAKLKENYSKMMRILILVWMVVANVFVLMVAHNVT